MPTLAELNERREEALADIEKIISTAETFRRSPSANENARIETLQQDIRSIDDKIRAAEVEEASRNGVARELRKLGLTGSGAGRTSSRSGTYTPESRHSYFKDMLDARQGDSSARERLDRHRSEFRDFISARPENEVRAISTVSGAGGEFAPPEWLIDDYIAALRPARATADALTNLALPEGTDVLNVPKINTGTQVAIQTTQNTGIQQTDITTTTVAAPVFTIAGGQVFSQQLFDQSPMAGSMDRVVLQDLLADYAHQLGSLVINGTGTGGQPTGLLAAAGNTITYTDATPGFMGVGKLYAKIAQADQTVQTSRFLSPTAIIMSPRRWAWASVQVDSSNRAVILPDGNGPLNASGIQINGNAEGVVGKMFNRTVIVDPNIPTNLGAGTNQDPIIVVKADDSWLYESNLRAEVFSETYANTLGLFARVFNYAALAHRIPQSIAVINGTGLVAPTF